MAECGSCGKAMPRKVSNGQNNLSTDNLDGYPCCDDPDVRYCTHKRCPSQAYGNPHMACEACGRWWGPITW